MKPLINEPPDTIAGEHKVSSPAIGTSGRSSGQKVRVPAGNRCRKASIRFRLASLVIACVLPVWIAAGFLVYYNYQSRRALTEQRMQETARALTMVVDRELANMQTGLNVLAASPSFASGNLPVFYGEARVVLGVYPGADILLADATGQQLVNTYVPFGAPLPKRNVPDTVRHIYETGQPVITNLFKGSFTGRTLISVDVPVFRDGRVIYDLAMAVPVDRFAAILSQQHLQPEWIGTIIGSDDAVVARTRLPEQYVGRTVTKAFLRQTANESQGITEVQNMEGTLMFDSFCRSARYGWIIAIGAPKSIIMGEIWRWLLWIVLGTALLSLAGIALALYIAQRIADSIQGLIAPVLALGRGESLAISHFELEEFDEAGESLVKASQMIQQRAAEHAIAEAARREAEGLKRLNAELERSEAEARARAAELTAIMDAVPAVTLIAHDPECRQITSNRTGYDLLRLRPGSFFSKSATEGIRPTHYRLLKDGRELSIDEMPMRMAATGREIRDYEYTLSFDDGDTREMFGNAVPLLDERGEVRGAVSAFIDITERKRAERALKKSEARLRSYLDNAPFAIIVAGRDGHIVDCNQETYRVLGYGAGELHGKPVMLLHPAEAQAAARENFVSLLQYGHYEGELRFIRKDGCEIWGALSTVMMENGSSLGFMHDVTAMRASREHVIELEEQFRQAQKMEAIGCLAGGIAHDFNNLLMVIQSYTELLHENFPAHSNLRKNTRAILKAADRATNLTRQMLAFSRKQVLSPVVLDLNAVVDETAKMLKRLIGEDIEFRVSASEALWAIEADPDQMVQVLMNLCVNARDAMPEGGTLTIATGNVTVAEGDVRRQAFVPPGDYVWLSVSDTGTGISEEVQGKIFDPFFTTKEVGKGTGMGLATVYGIVKQSNGGVWVESELGRGSCFTIYLPRIKEAISREIAARAETEAQGTETILVAEDEEALRQAMRDYLGSLGYTVLVAGSGKEALVVASEHEGHIDLLSTDVVMPGMSGRELSQMLGSLLPGLKTIYMSGYAGDVLLRHGIHDTGTAFLQKPFSLGTLARKVRELLQS